MPKFFLEKIVNTNIEKTFDIVTDFENLSKLLPKRFPSVRIRSTRNDTSVVETHLVINKKELVMMTKHVTNRPHIHEIFVIGGDNKGSQITERYNTINSNTKISIDINLKFGTMKIINRFHNNMIKEDYSKLYDEIIQLV